jgi:hypothetical protein
MSISPKMRSISILYFRIMISHEYNIHRSQCETHNGRFLHDFVPRLAVHIVYLPILYRSTKLSHCMAM